MSNELIAIIGVGVTLAGLILYSQHNLRADMQLQREETRTEFKAVRSEMQVQREETRAEFKAVRSEMQAGFRSMRSEMQAEFNKHLGAINSLREDVNRLHGRVARQEGLMEGLREAITGTRDLVAGPG